MSTKIEWCDDVWNPIVGCARVSEGCRHCYAERMARRLRAMGLPQYQDVVTDAGRWTGQLRLDEAALLKPLRWKKPRLVFVNSMSDLFHERVPDEWMLKVMDVMRRCPQHTLQILTKRPDRMCHFCSRLRFDGAGTGRLWLAANPEDRDGWRPFGGAGCTPLSHIWLGVSVEDQATADARIPLLLRTPAAVRFVSYEPALGPVRLWHEMSNGALMNLGPVANGRGLDWVIMGGESGPGARPMDPDWARSVRDQCQAAGVPFFFKQWGGVRKKDAGALLDGREWREWPACPAWRRKDDA